MKRTPFLILIILLLSVHQPGLAETDGDTLDLRPYKKGVNLVGISGFVSSSGLIKSNNLNQSSKLGNSYRFEVRLGKFMTNKSMLGLEFYTNKVNLVGTIESTAEITSVGPFYRIYLGKTPDIALILISSVHWSKYFSQTLGLISPNLLNHSIEAQGIQGSLGVGITYVMAKRVTFEVTSAYSMSTYWGVLSDYMLDEEHDITLNLTGLKFSFGFTVLFGKLKEHE